VGNTEPFRRGKNGDELFFIPFGKIAEELLFNPVAFLAGRTYALEARYAFSGKFGQNGGQYIHSQNGHREPVAKRFKIRCMTVAKTSGSAVLCPETPVRNVLKKHVVDVPFRTFIDDAAYGTAFFFARFFKREPVYVFFVIHRAALYLIVDRVPGQPRLADESSDPDMLRMDFIRREIFRRVKFAYQNEIVGCV